MTDEPDGLAASLARITERMQAAGPVDVTDEHVERAARERDEQWAMRIPRRFRDADVDELTADVAAHLDAWTGMDPVPNLLLFGPVGVGKTYAAVVALRMCLERGDTIAFAPVVEALDSLRPGGADDAARVLMRTRVLLLDDVGAERPTDWTTERLYAVVNRRWLNGQPTIVTTNVEPAALEGALEARLFSRLVHDAYAIEMTGRDRRRK